MSDSVSFDVNLIIGGANPLKRPLRALASGGAVFGVPDLSKARARALGWRPEVDKAPSLSASADAEALFDAVSSLSTERHVSRRRRQPEQEREPHISLSGDGGQLRVRARAGGCFAYVDVAAAIVARGEFVTNAAPLLRCLTGADGDAKIREASGLDAVDLETSAAKFNLPMLLGSAWKGGRWMTGLPQFTIEAAALRRGLLGVLHAASQNPGKPSLAAVRLLAQEGALRAMAYNGTQAAVCEIAASAPRGWADLAVPRVAAVMLAGAIRGGGAAHVTLDGARVQIMGATWGLVCDLAPPLSDPPRLAEINAEDRSFRGVVDRRALLQAAQFASLPTGRPASVSVLVSCFDGFASVASTSADGGAVREVRMCGQSGFKPAIAVNADDLIAALRAGQDADAVLAVNRDHSALQISYPGRAAEPVCILAATE